MAESGHFFAEQQSPVPGLCLSTLTTNNPTVQYGGGGMDGEKEKSHPRAEMSNCSIIPPPTGY